MNRHIFLSLFFFLLIFGTSFGSQYNNFKPGYIISNNLDTLFGYINFGSNDLNSVKCEFKKDLKSNIQVYTPVEIKSYYLTDTRHYVSKTINLNGEDKTLFLEYLVDGVVDLYFYSIGMEDYFFIEKDGKLFQLNNNEIETFDENGVKHVRLSNQFKGAMKSLFNDAPELDIAIIKSEFNLTSLINLTKNYHKIVCNDEKCIDYSKLVKKEIYCEAVTGVDLSFMGLVSSKNYSNGIDPVFGFNFRYNDNHYNSKFDFVLGLNIIGQKYNGEFQNTLYNQKRTYGIYLNYSLVRVPFTLEYLLFSGRFQPMVSLSLVNCFLVKSSRHLEIRSYLAEDDYYALQTESPLRKYQFGIELGAGFMYNISPKSYVICKLSGEYRESAKNFNYILDYLNFKSLLFRIGYGIKIK